MPPVNQEPIQGTGIEMLTHIGPAIRARTVVRNGRFIMNELFSKFDPYAMIHPKTEDDMCALLDEANSEMDNIGQHLQRLTQDLERNRKREQDE